MIQCCCQGFVDGLLLWLLLLRICSCADDLVLLPRIAVPMIRLLLLLAAAALAVAFAIAIAVAAADCCCYCCCYGLMG